MENVETYKDSSVVTQEFSFTRIKLYSCLLLISTKIFERICIITKLGELPNPVYEVRTLLAIPWTDFS
jgi:hypothetical protein